MASSSNSSSSSSSSSSSLRSISSFNSVDSVANSISSDAIKTGTPVSDANLISGTSLQSLYTDSSSTFEPQKTLKSIELVNTGLKPTIPAQSLTYLAAQKVGTSDKDGKLGSDGIFASSFGDSTKAGASYFDPQAWTKELKLVAGNKNAYTLQGTSDDGKKTLTVTEVATGKDPYGTEAAVGANGAVKETIVFTGSDNDRFVSTYASNAVNVADANASSGSSVDALNTVKATTYVNANKGMALSENHANTHKYNEANGVKALSDGETYAYNYKDKGVTIVESTKFASNSVDYTKLDKAVANQTSGANYYFENSNPENAVKVQYTATTAHTYNKTAVDTFKDVVVTNLAQYKLSDNSQLDSFTIEARGVITATTTDKATTVYTYANPSLKISNNAYSLTVKSFSTTDNGLNYANSGITASNNLNRIVADTTDAKKVVYAKAAVGDTPAVVAREAVTTITGTVNNDEIKVVIPVDKAGLNASNTINKGTATGGTASGGAGNDTIIGGALDDVLTGGAGADVLTGGAGKDTFKIDQYDVITDWTAADNSPEFTFAYSDGVTSASTAGKKEVADFEKTNKGIALTLVSTSAKDSAEGVKLDLSGLRSKGGYYNVAGTDKNDTIIGGEKADIINGGKGVDSLTGNKGDDVLNGGDGADTLNGGEGNDILTGGADSDTFTFNVTVDSNKVTDFKTADGDKIDLSAIDAKKTTAADDAFTLLAAGTVFSGEGQLKFDVATNTLQGNTDGDLTTFEVSIVLTGVTVVTDTNLVL